MNWKGKLANAAGIGMLLSVVSMVSVVKAEAAWGGRVAVSEEPMVRLLSLQIFWMDQEGMPVAGGGGVVRPAIRSPQGSGSGGVGVTRTLFEGRGGGSTAGESAALMVVPWSNNAREYYVVSQAGAGPVGFNLPRFETIVGTRSSDRSGTIHTLNLARAATLSSSARAEVGRLVDLGLMGGTVYWEAAFELIGLHRDEIDSVEALGPGLIKPPRKWMGLLGQAMKAPAAAAGVETDPCLKLGPLSFCLNVPKIAGFLSSQRRMKERSRVRLTRSLWHAGDSCGVVVFGRMSSYSVLTFRVRTNGRGTIPAGVRYLPPFDLASTPGWSGTAGTLPAEELRGGVQPPPAGTVARSGGGEAQGVVTDVAAAPDRIPAATPMTATALEISAPSITPRWSARIWGLSPARAECYTPQGRRLPGCASRRTVTHRIGW